MRDFGKRLITGRLIHLLFSFSAFIFLISGISYAATIELPQTGQKPAVPTPPFAAGDDASKMRGAAWPSPRFTDNNNGTVTDNLTGLIWLKNANCTDTVGGVAKGGGTLTWANALTWANNLADTAINDCGLTDGSTAGQWRLPSVNELQSIINLGQANPATWLNASGGFGNPFTNVQSGLNVSYYWSSTTYALTTTNAWILHMYNGFVTFNAKSIAFYVWPVRGGQ